MDFAPFSRKALSVNSQLIIDGGTEHFIDEISGESDDVLPEQEGNRDAVSYTHLRIEKK